MKVGADNPKKTGIAIALAVASVLLLVYEMSPTAAPVANSAPATVGATNNMKLARRQRNKPQASTKVLDDSLDPRLRLPLLKTSEQTSYDGAGRNIFRAEVEVAEIPKPVAPAITPPRPQPPPGPPPPPPINLRFFGFATKAGGPKRVFLAQGDEVFVAAEGDIVNRRYKVVRISANSVEIQDVLNNNVQTIPLSQS